MGKETIFEESSKDFNERSKQRVILGIVILVMIVPGLIMVTVVLVIDDFPRQLPFAFLMLLMLVGVAFFSRWYIRRIKEASPLKIYMENGEEYFELNKKKYKMNECLIQTYPSSFEIYYHPDKEKKETAKTSVYWVKDEPKEELLKRWYKEAEKNILKEQKKKKKDKKRKKKGRRPREHRDIIEKEYLTSMRFSELYYFNFSRACELLAPAFILVFVIGGAIFAFMSIFYGFTWIIHDMAPLSQLCSLVVFPFVGFSLILVLIISIKSQMTELKGVKIGIKMAKNGIKITNHLKDKKVCIETIPYDDIISIKRIRSKPDLVPYLRFRNPFINIRAEAYCFPFVFNDRILAIRFREFISLRPWYLDLPEDEVSKVEEMLMKTIYIPVERNDQKDFIDRLNDIIGKK